MSMPASIFEQLIDPENLDKAAAAHRLLRPWSFQPPGADLDGLREALLEGRFRFQPPAFHILALNKPVLAAEPLPADWIVGQLLASVLNRHFKKNAVAYCGYELAYWEILEAMRDEWAVEKNWCVQADIQQFFRNIRHEVLLAVVSERLACAKTTGLLQQLLAALDEGSLLFSEKYPEHLHLEGVGLPIGTELPYVLANALLHPIDLKMSKLCNGFYGRYLDDLAFFADTADTAHAGLGALSDELLKLGLVLGAEKTAVFACK